MKRTVEFDLISFYFWSQFRKSVQKEFERMSWEDQGRQEHGWFGHGRSALGSAGKSDEKANFEPEKLAQRISDVVGATIAALPRHLRREAERQFAAGGRQQLSEGLANLVGGATLSRDTFDQRYFGEVPANGVAGSFYAAVQALVRSDGKQSIADAAGEIADAMQSIGLERWERFNRMLLQASTAEDKIDPTRTESVPFVDDFGKTFPNRKGEPMVRPAGMDPHFFVNQGLKDRQHMQDLLSSHTPEGAEAAAGYLIGQLLKFDRWASWDAQRVGGAFHEEFVDYATVAIGLYAAAAGIPRDTMLSIENIRAITSRWRPGTKMDPHYKNLPVINVHNTDTGYELYKSGSISSAKQPAP